MKALRRAHVKRYKVISRLAGAAECIGPLRPGDEITGLTCGQFSAIDILEHMLNELGPADVCVSTWTAGLYDVDQSARLKERGYIRSIRMLLDRAMFSKSPQYAGPLIDALGLESFRDANVHAKVTIVEGERGAAVMRASMNLNKNLRTEQFDISVCAEVAAFYRRWFDGLWMESAPKREAEHVFAAVYDKWQQTRGDPPRLGVPRASDIAKALRGAA